MAPNPLQAAEDYWNAAAETYEQNFSGTAVGVLRREAVWHELQRTFAPGQRLLEINCGTGLDAVFLARRQMRVLACDISPRMIELAKELAANEQLAMPPDFRVLATEHLHALLYEGLFDGAFSNFSGLNCVEDLPRVARDLALLLQPGATFLLCMMGRFVPLEILWFCAHGEPRKALQRLREPRTRYPTTGLVVHRPTVAQVKRLVAPSFRLRRWKGIGIVIPPSYAEHVAVRFPGLLLRLALLDRMLGQLPIFRGMADCVLMEFERVSDTEPHEKSR